MRTLDPRSAEELRLAPEMAAERAGLVYVTDEIPGITRERDGERWRYRRPDGSVVTDPDERAGIEAIGISPAWTHVWISPLPDGHSQATGRDGRGRKQYRYRPRWREVQDRTNFHRLVASGHALPGPRTRIDHDLDRPGLPRENVPAAVLRLMDQTPIGIGNEEYARHNESFGLATLRHEHIRLDDPATVAFEFRATPPRSATDARRKIVAAIDAAAARLNNTRAVCRASYVSPRVPDAYAEGSLMPAVARAQERERFSRSEATLVQVLG